MLLKKSRFFSSIKKEAENILEQQQQTANFLSPPEILKQLIRNTREVASLNKNLILLRVNEKPIVSCHQDKLGKLSIVFEKQAKSFDRIAVEEACLKAINDYLFQDTIPRE